MKVSQYVVLVGESSNRGSVHGPITRLTDDTASARLTLFDLPGEAILFARNLAQRSGLEVLVARVDHLAVIVPSVAAIETDPDTTPTPPFSVDVPRGKP